MLNKPPTKNDTRDAIHIAIIPLIAGEDFWHKDPVRLGSDKTKGYCGAYGSCIGIVNPWRKGPVKKGELFWCVLNPDTVTGMKHYWQHPDFPNEVTIESLTEEISVESIIEKPMNEQSEEEHLIWLKTFADEWNFDLNELIFNAKSTDQENDWRCVVAQGHDLHSIGDLGNDYHLFWDHLEGYLNKKFDKEHRDGMNWSCSC